MRFLGAKYAKMCLRPGLRPRSRWGSAPSNPQPGFKGPTSKATAGQRRGGKEKGKEGSGRKGGGEAERGSEIERVIPVLLFPRFEPWVEINKRRLSARRKRP